MRNVISVQSGGSDARKRALDRSRNPIPFVCRRYRRISLASKVAIDSLAPNSRLARSTGACLRASWGYAAKRSKGVHAQTPRAKRHCDVSMLACAPAAGPLADTEAASACATEALPGPQEHVPAVHAPSQEQQAPIIDFEYLLQNFDMLDPQMQRFLLLIKSPANVSNAPNTEAVLGPLTKCPETLHQLVNASQHTQLLRIVMSVVHACLAPVEQQVTQESESAGDAAAIASGSNHTNVATSIDTVVSGVDAADFANGINAANVASASNGSNVARGINVVTSGVDVTEVPTGIDDTDVASDIDFEAFADGIDPTDISSGSDGTNVASGIYAAASGIDATHLLTLAPMQTSAASSHGFGGE